MLLISLQVPNFIDREYSWHIGQKNPFKIKECNHISYIIADGDELEHIHNMFPNPVQNFPLNRRVVTIYGDLAKTIVANL